MRVLLLEDDEDVGPWVRTGLKENGHVVDLFANGKDALIAATLQSYDLFIFDRMVPELDGLSLLKSLRSLQCLTFDTSSSYSTVRPLLFNLRNKTTPYG